MSRMDLKDAPRRNNDVSVDTKQYLIGRHNGV